MKFQALRGQMAREATWIQARLSRAGEAATEDLRGMADMTRYRLLGVLLASVVMLFLATLGVTLAPFIGSLPALAGAVLFSVIAIDRILSEVFQ